MDVLVLIDKLDDLVHNAKAVPLTDQVRIDREEQDIVDDARRQARETRLEMEDWADSILSTLEVNLEKFLTAVKRGRERLHERSQETVMAGVAVTTGSSNEQPYDET